MDRTVVLLALVAAIVLTAPGVAGYVLSHADRNSLGLSTIHVGRAIAYG